MSPFLHDPDAVLDYKIDWSQWLEDTETISTSEWIVEDGLTQATPEPSHTPTDATIWLSGGTDGQSYSATNRITTSLGRTQDKTITLRARQR